VRELRPGLWHWEAPHPQWRPTEPWSENVSSYAIDDGERLLLFDPLAVPSELGDLAAGRETAIVLTAPWHERDAQSVVERLRVPVYTPLPDTAQDLMDMYGVTAEQAGDGSPDLVWLLREKKGEARPYSPGDRLPFGADVFAGHKKNDTVLWVESQRAVISGDTLGDFGRGRAATALYGGHASSRRTTSSVSSPRPCANARPPPTRVKPHFSSTRMEPALSLAARA
jgi:glyoxylase-like metal-dependent hydrolase (beta-lactamase superfamily II)